MKTFKQFLFEGGNVQIGAEEANRIDLKRISRDAIVPILYKGLEAINKEFEKQMHMPLWSKELFKSKEFLSGSAFHFFDQGIHTVDFTSVKSTVGDIDTQVDSNMSPMISTFLTNNVGMLAGELQLIGHKDSAGQFISLWKLPKYGINVQIDFEAVDFKDGKPTDWAQFSHSSHMSDLKEKIKGVFQKYLLRAIGAKDIDDFVILTGKKEVPKVKKATELAFSVTKGLRVKLQPVMDGNIHRKDEIGRAVYREIDSKLATNYVTDLDVMFEMWFGHLPSAQDKELMKSFVGLVDLCVQNFNSHQLEFILAGFIHTLWGPGAQSLYRGDPKSDLDEKMIAFAYIANKFNIPIKKYDIVIADYYKTLK